jgi:hypothetical protein
MTTATFIKKPKRLRRLREGPLGAHLELFSARLLTEGHFQTTRLDAEAVDCCCFGIEQSIFAAPHTPRIQLLSH